MDTIIYPHAIWITLYRTDMEGVMDSKPLNIILPGYREAFEYLLAPDNGIDFYDEIEISPCFSHADMVEAGLIEDDPTLPFFDDTKPVTVDMSVWGALFE